ncbi:uncharacterized protein LOC135706465 [Ochlerotatus camptorhynchus]|uniref:uncharacterized protein LOC135706465 n=1 Tax=Ochlerotatus camptorhynchus TaxID=644619 RepID=UPI0031D226E7
MFSAEEDLSATEGGIPSKESIAEKFELLKSKFLTILEQRFFGNLKHDWSKSAEVDPQDQSLSSFVSLSDDSGSYLIMEGKKISFDWFRNALARSASDSESEATALPVAVAKPKVKIETPFQVGTPEQMAALMQVEDRFHTHKSRARQGMRGRLLVEDVPFEEEILGIEKKYPSKLATQVDLHYRNEISHRPRIRNFVRSDSMHKLREASRKQFETFYRKEYLYEQSKFLKAERLQHKKFDESLEEISEALRKVMWQRFSQSQREVDSLKPCLDETARLEKEFRDRQPEMDALWNGVIKMERTWAERIKCQNFLYLIMPNPWRKEYDWIHRDEQGELEGYPESIANRSIVNLRSPHENNDIWAVKEFFEKEYLEKDKPIYAVFEDSSSLLRGIDALDVNLMTLLSRLNVLNWAETEAKKEAEDVKKHYDRMIENLQFAIHDLTDRKVRCENRTAQLKDVLNRLAKDPLWECVANERTRNLDTLLYVLYKNLLPRDQQDSALKFSGTESFSYVFNLITQLLTELDKIPPKFIKSADRQVRFEHKHMMNEARRAAKEDHRQRQMAIQLKRCLAPPYVRPPRTGKLPRSRLKKKPAPEVVVPSTETKFDRIFRLGFGEHAIMTEAERRGMQVNSIYQNYSSVQFDHFLRSIGYEPVYDFVSKVEERDGPETNFFQRKELIPHVLRRMKRYDEYQEKLKQKMFKRMTEILDIQIDD